MSRSTSSGLIAADGAIRAQPCTLTCVQLIGGSDAATVVIYDNPSAASGTVLAKLKVAAETSVSVSFESPVLANYGLYADVTGTAVGCIVSYEA